MKTFSCGDVVPGCTARWSAPTENEILGHVAAHAADAHAIATVTPELVAAVRAAIVTV